MWIAEMETEHFSWIAAGETKEEALRALSLGWDSQVGKLDIDAELVVTGAETLESYGASVFELAPGVCLRDREAL